jgi:hypothetical protein
MREEPPLSLAKQSYFASHVLRGHFGGPFLVLIKYL